MHYEIKYTMEYMFNIHVLDMVLGLMIGFAKLGDIVKEKFFLILFPMLSSSSFMSAFHCLKIDNNLLNF